METYYNPYTGQSFFGFFYQLFLRILSFARGEELTLASDEIQIIVLVGVAASSALVGCYLILRRMAMLANSLSHTILLGIVFAYLFTRSQGLESHSPLPIQAMLIAALAMGLITTFLTEFLIKTVKLQADASCGIVFTSLFALGIVAVTLLTRSAHIGTEVVMGNVDALQLSDAKLVYLILAMNAALILLFYKEYKITTFDPALSRAVGISTLFFNYLLMTQVSATAIGAFRAVGVLMVLALITGPALTARFFTHKLKNMLLLAVGIGCAAALFGVALSRHFLSVQGIALSTAGVVVCVITLFFTVGAAYRWIQTRA